MPETDDEIKHRTIAARFAAGAKECGMGAVTVDLSEFSLQDIDAAGTHWKAAIARFRDDLIFKIGDQLPLTLEITWINYRPSSTQHRLRPDQLTSRLDCRRAG